MNGHRVFLFFFFKISAAITPSIATRAVLPPYAYATCFSLSSDFRDNHAPLPPPPPDMTNDNNHHYSHHDDDDDDDEEASNRGKNHVRRVVY
jgi:hypothetical protein